MTLKQQINAHKRLTKNERKRLILFGFSFYSLFGAWNIVGIFQNVSKTHLQRRGHPSRPFSVSVPFVSRHPSRSSVSETSSNQVSQIYVVISFPGQFNWQVNIMLFKRTDLQNDYKTSVNSQLCKQNGYNSVIQNISYQNTYSFSHPLLHTHRYTPSQPPTHPTTHHCCHQQDSHIAGPLHTTQS